MDLGEGGMPLQQPSSCLLITGREGVVPSYMRKAARSLGSPSAPLRLRASLAPLFSLLAHRRKKGHCTLLSLRHITSPLKSALQGEEGERKGRTQVVSSVTVDDLQSNFGY